jgi:hypothetical protein
MAPSAVHFTGDVQSKLATAANANAASQEKANIASHTPSQRYLSTRGGEYSVRHQLTSLLN